MSSFMRKMNRYIAKYIREQKRFNGIFVKRTVKDGEVTVSPEGASDMFEREIPLSGNTVYEEEKEFLLEAADAGYDGRQTDKFSEDLIRLMGIEYALPLSSGEAALQMALRLAAEKVFGSTSGTMEPRGIGSRGVLFGERVFCPDFAPFALGAMVVAEGGEPVFIDSGVEDWSMDPEVLEMAFDRYPDVKIVLANSAYGFPGDVVRIRQLCFQNDALLIECAGEALGASYWVGKDGPDTEGGVWGKAGVLGDYCVMDFSPGKIISGTAGGALLVRDSYEYQKAKYWSSGARADTPWNQHEEFGRNCMMGDPIAAVIRARLKHLDEIIEKKKKIHERYVKELDGGSGMAYALQARKGIKPNYWITCMTSESNIEFDETRNDRKYTYRDLHGTAAPMEMFDALNAFGACCMPTYKPMSMQPVFRNNEHFTLDGAWRRYEDFYADNYVLRCDRAKEYFERGICLPSDVSMTDEEQGKIIDIVHACYDKTDLDRLAWA